MLAGCAGQPLFHSANDGAKSHSFVEVDGTPIEFIDAQGDLRSAAFPRPSTGARQKTPPEPEPSIR
jgi:hypothetical protein